MSTLPDQRRAAIPRLYFVEQLRLNAIATALQLGRSTVRRVLVIDGDAVRASVRGPYHKECDS
jgi:DNA-binding transcriptional regulator LsrR (DeoR family)